MLIGFVRSFPIFALITLICSSASAAEPPRFSVTDLGNVVPSDINDRGQAVGTVATGNLLTGPAFLWENGTLTPLGTPPGETTFWEALSINNSGRIVGHRRLTPGGTPQAVLYDAGRVTDLPFQSVAAINDAGQVAGSATFSAVPLRYDDGVVTPIPPIAGVTTGQATAINSAGDVAGYMTSGAQQRAFLYRDGRTIDLGTLGRASFAEAVNDQGQVVGRSLLDFGEHAFLYSGDGMTDLGTLGGAASGASDINNHGQVVGFSYTPAGRALDITGFLWQDGTMYDLYDYMVSPPAGMTNFRGVAINDSGQIVGFGSVGGVARGYLLTPIPEPAGAALLGLTGLALLRRVRKA